MKIPLRQVNRTSFLAFMRDLFTRNASSNRSRNSTRNSLRGMERFEDRNLMAADFTLLQDINPGIAMGDIEPYGMVAIGNIAYFAATTPANGTELWKSDGTTAGTVMVKDVVPGADSSVPSDLVNINGTLYFSAVNAVANRDLWKSDGTAAGTVLVASGVIPSDVSTSTPPFITSVGNTIYFQGIDTTGGTELWTSDGTTAGTTRLADINPGTGDSHPASMTVFNGEVYFSADDGASGRELWKTNGTALGTVLVSDIVAGVEGSDPIGLAVFNNKIYFSATTLNEGAELWSTDGTQAGTSLLKDLNTAPESSLPYNFTVVNGTLLFSALSIVGSPQIWKTDGTAVGTVSVFTGFSPTQLVFDFGSWSVIGSSAYITIINDLTGGFEVWKSNGTTVGTVMATELTSGSNITDPQKVVPVGTLTYFVGTSPTAGLEVFVTNQAPTNISLSAGSVFENSSVSTAVGSLSTVDPNGFDNFAYSLVSGTGSTNNALFTISGNQLLVNGIIDFESTPTLSIRVRSTDNANLTTEKVIFINVTDLAEVLSVVVADGVQHSVVKQVTVTFDGPVVITNNPFLVQQRGGAVPTVVTAFTTTTNGLGQTVATVTFSGALTRPETTALEDGNYQLTIDPTNVKRSGVELDGDKNGVAGGNYVFGTQAADNFYSLYGDLDSNRAVTLSPDFAGFRAAFLRSANFNPNLDFNGDGVITLTDFGQFRSRFLRPLTFV